jgi:hypothetical protein
MTDQKTSEQRAMDFIKHHRDPPYTMLDIQTEVLPLMADFAKREAAQAVSSIVRGPAGSETERAYTHAFAMGIRAMASYWTALLKPTGQIKMALDELEMLNGAIFNGIEGIGDQGPGPTLFDANGDDWDRARRAYPEAVHPSMDKT